jgi:hypothetical protein
MARERTLRRLPQDLQDAGWRQRRFDATYSQSLVAGGAMPFRSDRCGLAIFYRVVYGTTTVEWIPM